MAWGELDLDHVQNYLDHGAARPHWRYMQTLTTALGSRPDPGPRALDRIYVAAGASFQRAR
jgi:hypothetical protein